MAKKFEVAVVGIGAVGAAALYQLSKRGISAVGIDRFDPPHSQGSSHGETRITRLAVGEGRDYVALAKRSHAIWTEITSKSAQQIYFPTGGILLDSGVESWEKHGTKNFFEQTVSLARTFQIEHKLIDSEQIRADYPQFLIGSAGKAYVEKAAGYLLPESAIANQLALAKGLGAKIYTNKKVKSIEKRGSNNLLIFQDEEMEVGKIILATGGWIKDFLPEDQSAEFKICRQILHWLELEKGTSYWNQSPVFMWGFGPKPEDFLYGFPSLDGQTVKMATESFNDSKHPDNLERAVSESEQIDFWENKVKGRIRGVTGRIKKSEVCFYTVSADGRFKIGFMDQEKSVLMASACSGHGFKHSAGLGEHLVEKLLDEELTVSLES